MSVPPWKQALIERKKQKEAEQQESKPKEDDLSGLPPWKRAILQKQREKESREKGVTVAPSPPTETHSTVDTKSDSTSTTDGRSVMPRSQSFDQTNKTLFAKPGTADKQKSESSEKQPTSTTDRNPDSKVEEKQTFNIPRSVSLDQVNRTLSKPDKQPTAMSKSESFENRQTDAKGINGKQAASMSVTDKGGVEQSRPPWFSSSGPQVKYKQPQLKNPITKGNTISSSSLPVISEDKAAAAAAAPQPVRDPLSQTRVAAGEERQTSTHPTGVVLSTTAQGSSVVVNSSVSNEPQIAIGQGSREESKAPNTGGQSAGSDQPSAAEGVVLRKPAGSAVRDGRNEKSSIEEKRRSFDEEKDSAKPIPAWKKALLERKKASSTSLPEVKSSTTTPETPAPVQVTLRPVKAVLGKLQPTTNAAPLTAPSNSVPPPSVATATPTSSKATTLTTPSAAPPSTINPHPFSSNAVPVSADSPTAESIDPSSIKGQQRNASSEQIKVSSLANQFGANRFPPKKPPQPLTITKPTQHFPPQRKVSAPAILQYGGKSSSTTAAPPPSTTTVPLLATPVSSTFTPTQPVTQAAVVNSDVKETPKLIEKEGVELRPPVFQEVKEWANVSEDDPSFQSLPQWKKSLILRRREDIAKRSATTASKTMTEQEPLSPKTVWSANSNGSTLRPTPSTTPTSAMGDNGKHTMVRVSSQETQEDSLVMMMREASADKPLSKQPSKNVKALLGKFVNDQGQQKTEPFATKDAEMKKQNIAHPTTCITLFDKSKEINRNMPVSSNRVVLPESSAPATKDTTHPDVFFAINGDTPEARKTSSQRSYLLSPPPNQLSPMKPSTGPAPGHNQLSPMKPSTGPAPGHNLLPGESESDEESDMEVTNIDDVLCEEEDEVDTGAIGTEPISIHRIHSDAFFPQESVSTAALLKLNDLDQNRVNLSTPPPPKFQLPPQLPSSPPQLAPSPPPISPPPSFSGGISSQVPQTMTPPTSPTPSGSDSQKSSHGTPVSPNSSFKSILGQGKRKVMRRVSWSDTNLVVHHSYPKYTYDDYIEEENGLKDHEDDQEDGGSGKKADKNNANAILDLPVHPLLQLGKGNKDPYSSPKSNNPSTSPASNKSMHNYKPTIIASYGSSLHDQLGGRSYLSAPDEDQKKAPSSDLSLAEISELEDRPDEQSIAALIW